MSPNNKNIDKVNGVKWLFKSVFGGHKPKTGAVKKVKGVNYEDNVCDAVPDSARKDKTSPCFESNNKDTDDEKSERCFKTSDGEGFEDEKPKNEQSNSSSQDSKRKREYFNQQSENIGGMPPQASQTNILINNGINTHIGHQYTYVNNFGFPNSNQPQQPTQIPKTEAIKAILKSKEVVNSAHLQCAASHFGKQWKAIGNKLGFTEGEINNLKMKFNERNEASYKMLLEWATKRGTKATVGQLCIELWDSNLKNAAEAVHQLSINICNF